MAQKKPSWKQFLADAQGNFSVFTLVSLLAGFTLVTSPLVTRLLGWAVLTTNELGTLTLIYCISALSDYLLAIYINKMPSLNVDNVQNLNLGAEEVPTAPAPECDENKPAE